MASSLSSLVLASLPGTAHSHRVVVLRGSHAETIAEQNGFDTLAVRSIVQAPGLLASGQAAFWLEGAAEVAMVEFITGLSFAREALPADRERRLRHAWSAARTATELQALYRDAGIGSILV